MPTIHRTATVALAVAGMREGKTVAPPKGTGPDEMTKFSFDAVNLFQKIEGRYATQERFNIGGAVTWCAKPGTARIHGWKAPDAPAETGDAGWESGPHGTDFEGSDW